MSSGAGTNLKVGEHMSGAKRRKTFCRASPRFGFTSISRFGKRFLDGQHAYSLVSFLFAVLLTVPRTLLFVKVVHLPPRPIKSAPLRMSVRFQRL